MRVPVDRRPTTAQPARSRRTGVAAALLLVVLGACSPSPSDVVTAPATAAAGSAVAPTPLGAAAAPGSTTGGLAPDFPTRLLAVPEGAEILLSAVTAVSPDTVHVSLNLRSAQDASSLATDLLDPLTAAGFAIPVAPSTSRTAGTEVTTVALERGPELVTIAVLDRDGTRTVTVSATLARTSLPAQTPG